MATAHRARIMIFGRWRPYGALMASLLFGFTIALSANLKHLLEPVGHPQQFISMLPTSFTIAAVRDSSVDTSARATAFRQSRVVASNVVRRFARGTSRVRL